MKEYNPSRCMICGDMADYFPEKSEVDEELRILFERAWPDKHRIPLCGYHDMTHEPGIMKGTR